VATERPKRTLKKGVVLYNESGFCARKCGRKAEVLARQVGF